MALSRTEQLRASIARKSAMVPPSQPAPALPLPKPESKPAKAKAPPQPKGPVPKFNPGQRLVVKGSPEVLVVDSVIREVGEPFCRYRFKNAGGEEIVIDEPKLHHAPRKPKPKRTDEEGRLPDGAEFRVTFAADPTMWTGTLTVDGKVFTASKSGVFGLLQKLDMFYRSSLKKAEGETN